MSGSASTIGAAAAIADPRPTRLMQFCNLVVVHIAWFAAVLGSAHHLPLLGTAVVVASLAWHLAVSARWRVEAKLLGAVLLIGLAVESAMAPLQVVRFTSGQLAVGTAPYWMVSLWGVLAIGLNVTMRWLKGRWLLAAIAGGVVGPFSYVSGVGLGAASFVDETVAVTLLVILWAVLMPVLMTLSNRWDGVAVPDPVGAGQAGGLPVSERRVDERPVSERQVSDPPVEHRPLDGRPAADATFELSRTSPFPHQG